MTGLRSLLQAQPSLKGLTINRIGAPLTESFIPTPGEYFPTDWMPWRTTPWSSAHEEIGNSFDGYVSGAYKANGIVFACILARMMPFSEARFQYQRFNAGRPGDLWGDESLRILERPWSSGTTGELLARMEQDVSLAGNAYLTTVGEGAERRIRRLRPDWVTIVSGVRGDADAGPFELDADVLGYIYAPKMTGGRRDPVPVFLSADRVVHWSPIPDPDHQWRGMSWITPVIDEIAADSAATQHKLKFFENGASLQTVISYDATITPDQFREYVKAFEDAHSGVDNAYKTLHVGNGADPKTIGADLKQLDFKTTQGAGETRIAAASGVGAVVAQFSEGLDGSSLNTGNYSAAKRRVSDMHFRPMWRSVSAALERLVSPPSGSRLWYDDRDIEFLKEDAKDAAEIFKLRAESIRALSDGGYKPDSVIAAVSAENPALLEHTGLLPVQVQPPGSGDAVDPDA